VLDSIGPIPSDVVIARHDVPPAVTTAVRRAFLRMHGDAEGRALLSSLFTAKRTLAAPIFW
jgi:ABC-type phosphate/phosphonate transport system substrate-binding protein